MINDGAKTTTAITTITITFENTIHLFKILFQNFKGPHLTNKTKRKTLHVKPYPFQNPG